MTKANSQRNIQRGDNSVLFNQFVMMKANRPAQAADQSRNQINAHANKSNTVRTFCLYSNEMIQMPVVDTNAQNYAKLKWRELKQNGCFVLKPLPLVCSTQRPNGIEK